MPKVNSFKVKIETGDTGTTGTVYFNFNNHKLPFENVSGGTGPGEVFEGGFDVGSFAHSMALAGPEKGEWHINSITVDIDSESTPPYSVRFGKVTLDETTELNIWQDPPLPSFDV